MIPVPPSRHFAFNQGPISSATSAQVDSIRLAVLAHFGAYPREWNVVFTSGATAALKLVGEQFPWSPEADGSLFVHDRASHNSVLGIREYALAGGAGVRCVDIENLDGLDFNNTGYHNNIPCLSSSPSVEVRSDSRCGCACSCDASGGGEGRSRTGGCLSRDALPKSLHSGAHRDGVGEEVEQDSPRPTEGSRAFKAGRGEDQDRAVDCLFAFPAECNATGMRSDLSIAERVKRWGELDSNSCCRCDSTSSKKSSGECRGSHLWPSVQTGRSDPCNVPDDTDSGNEDARAETCECRGTTAPATVEAEACVPGEPRNPTASLSCLRCMPRRRRKVKRKRRQWWVIVDAAKFVGTAPLDLSNVDADFVVVSFYKMFG